MTCRISKYTVCFIFVTGLFSLVIYLSSVDLRLMTGTTVVTGAISIPEVIASGFIDLLTVSRTGNAVIRVVIAVVSIFCLSRVTSLLAVVTDSTKLMEQVSYGLSSNNNMISTRSMRVVV